MRRRDFGKLGLGAFGAWALADGTRSEASAAAAAPPQDRWPGYKHAVVIDALGGPGGFVPDEAPYTALSPWMIEDVRKSGCTAANVTLGALGNEPDLVEVTFREIAFWQREIDTHPDVFMVIRTAADLAIAKRTGRLGLIYGFQDGTPLGTDVTRLDLYHRFGVRILQPTYNGRNLLGDGCLEPANGGLSVFGRKVIARMNEIGMLVDLSHCGARTTEEAIAASTQPVAITHSGCAALVDFPRNKSDAQLRSMADKGGVVGIYFMPFLRKQGQPMAEDVVRHVEHALQVCGEDHVGIGTDGNISGTKITPEFVKSHHEFVQSRRAKGIAAPGEDENVFNLVPDLDDARRFDLLASQLASRGHSARIIEKVIGQNFARLFKEVWRA